MNSKIFIRNINNEDDVNNLQIKDENNTGNNKINNNNTNINKNHIYNNNITLIKTQRNKPSIIWGSYKYNQKYVSNDGASSVSGPRVSQLSLTFFLKKFINKNIIKIIYILVDISL
ncbi:hypothetical protein DMUE_1349 [Dictyocoela muelleri]|nr:hypothetical protein DMUE_1349 [Dictyocoela muelleri]